LNYVLECVFPNIYNNKRKLTIIAMLRGYSEMEDVKLIALRMFEG